MNFELLDCVTPHTWDKFVSSSPCGHFMQSAAWGAFQKNAGWETHFCALKNGSLLQGAALLLSQKTPVINAKVFYAPRGPVIDFADHETTDFFIKQIASYVKGQKGIFLRCDPYVAGADLPDGQAILSPMIRIPRDWSYWNAPKLVLWLDLQGDEDAVFMRMTSGCRNEVRRGYRNDVEFTLGSTVDLPEFYNLMSITGQHKSIAFHDFDYYQRLYTTLNTAAKAQLFLGRHEGEVITTGISVIYGKKAWLLYAASTPSSYKLRANRSLQWEMIKWAHAHGCDRYDLRGTATNDPPSPEDPGYGVYEFKKSFGAEYTRLAGYYDLVNRPILYRVLRTAEEQILPRAYRVRTWLNK